jgi:hypothetical protein
MRRFIPFMTNNNVISNEFPEPVEGNEVKNLLAFSRIKFLLINLSLVVVVSGLKNLFMPFSEASGLKIFLPLRARRSTELGKFRIK